MNSPLSSPGRSRHRKPGLLALLGSLAAVALVVTPLMPAHASIDDAAPVDAGTGSNTEIVITGVSEGLRLTGYLPPTAIVPEPTTPYPDSPPADYTSRSGFIGIITTKSVNDPSSTGEMYCIAARTPTAVGVGYQSGTWSESTVPNIGYVTYILNNYYPAVAAPAGLTPNQQAAATQSAIWYFTDGLVLGAENEVVRTAAAEIIAAAQAHGPVTEPEAPVAIGPASAAAPEGAAAGPYVVTAEGSAAVTVSVPTGYAMYSDPTATTPIPNASSVPSGTSVWITGPGVTGAEVVLNARATVTVQRGNVYLYDGNTASYSTAQPMVLADTAQFDAVATATTEFFAAGDLTVTKAFAGAAVGQQGAAQLVIDCGEGYRFTQEIPAGTSTTQTYAFRGIPVGYTCTVVEPITGATPEVSVTADVPEPGTMAETGIALTVTNTVELDPQAVPGGSVPPSGGDAVPPSGGDAVSMPGGDALANTGADAPMPLLGAAAGVIGLGLLLMLVVRANRRKAE